MDRKQSLLNVMISVLSKLVLLVFSLLARRYLIRYAGNNINGLNSFFLSLIGILSVAELGIGTAISFSMYAPIVNKDYQKVSALYNLFRRAYHVIGIIIFSAGCILLPFLKYFIKDYSEINVNIIYTFMLMLISTTLTYCFSVKISLINAHKDNYVTTLINSGGQLVQYLLQITVLVITSSFTYYLLCSIIAVIVQWIVTEIVFAKKYDNNLSAKDTLDKKDKSEVVKNIKAMLMHKIGAVLVNSFDSVIISAFIGVVILGKYSNYVVIITSMTALLMLFFTPLTSTIGHLCVKDDKTEVLSYFKVFYGINFSLGCVFFLGYYLVIDDFVLLIFGNNLGLNKEIIFVITANYFIQFMRQSVLLFRDATGTFYHDRWKPVIEGIFNSALSVLFVMVFPEPYKIVGVIVATCITNLVICHAIEPYVLFKYGLKKNARPYYIMNYLSIGLFLTILYGASYIKIPLDNALARSVCEGLTAVLVAIIPIGIHFTTNKDFRKKVISLRR